MTYEKMIALQSLAIEQGIKIDTVSEFAKFANSMKL